MADDQQLGSVIAAAEQAAGAGDFLLAERHLRQAAALQEAQFGPAHPDLANTLNNLGVACEQAGKLDEAEESYRRAYAIALVAFPPDHPFVVRSTENLRDFCAARDRPFDPPAPVVRDAAPIEAPSAAAEVPPTSDARPPAPALPAPVPVAAPSAAARSEYSAPERPAAARSRWPIALAAVAGLGALAAWLFLGGGAAAPTVAIPESQSPPPAAAELPAEREAAADPTPPVETPVPDSPPAQATQPTPPPVAPGASGASLTVARADVCRNFSAGGEQWRCDVVAEATTPGVVVFLTRVRSPRPATVVHRWYRDDALMQRVELRVGANPGAGYRTYSRNTVTAGNWRVELLDSAGTLLHQQRFVVR